MYSSTMDQEPILEMRERVCGPWKERSAEAPPSWRSGKGRIKPMPAATPVNQRVPKKAQPRYDSGAWREGRVRPDDKRRVPTQVLPPSRVGSALRALVMLPILAAAASLVLTALIPALFVGLLLVAAGLAPFVLVAVAFLITEGIPLPAHMPRSPAAGGGSLR